MEKAALHVFFFHIVSQLASAFKFRLRFSVQIHEDHYLYHCASPERKSRLKMRTTRSHTKLAKRAFHLLALPADLRLNIYEFLLVLCQNSSPRSRYATPSGSVTSADVRQVMAEKRDTFLQMLLVCRLIYDEAFPIFYHNHRFFFAATAIRSKKLDFERDFLNKLALKKVSQLRHLEFEETWDDDGHFFSASAFVKFLRRHKDLLNLDSCILVSTLNSQRRISFYQTKGESDEEYKDRIWNLQIGGTKELWEAGLMINDMMPMMYASRGLSEVDAESTGWFCRIFKVILRKDYWARF